MQYDRFDVLEAILIPPRGDIMISIQTKPVRAKLRTTISLNSGQVTLYDVERLEIYNAVTSCVDSEIASYQDATLSRVTACVCKDEAWKVT